MTTEETHESAELPELGNPLLDAIFRTILRKESQPRADMHALLDFKLEHRLNKADLSEFHRLVDLLALTSREAGMARAALMLSVAAGVTDAHPATSEWMWRDRGPNPATWSPPVEGGA